MKDLKPNDFFSLEGYDHERLWSKAFYVWDALKQIASYLEERSLGKIECSIPSSAYLINPELISIGEGSVIEPGAYIQGPCILGKNSVVRHGAYIRGFVVAGDRCVIGHDTEVKNTILLNDVSAGHFNYLGDSIVGNRVNLGAGAKCANLRLDRAPIVVAFEGQKVDTHLKKFGAILGDGVQLGCNCVTNPGTLIGKGTICFPCVTVGGVLPPNVKIKPEKDPIILGE